MKRGHVNIRTLTPFSLRELVDASNGAIRARFDYSPYGIRVGLEGDLQSDFGYTGHYTNAQTGLVLAPYRAYSPELGRWISRDPIEEDGGINLYGYVGNRPLQWVDPLGLVWSFSGSSNVNISTASGANYSFDVKSHNDLRFQLYKIYKESGAVTSLELISHGGRCGRDDIALGDGFRTFVAMMKTFMSEDGDLYLNGCKTSALADAMSTQPGMEKKRISGNKTNVRYLWGETFWFGDTKETYVGGSK